MKKLLTILLGMVFAFSLAYAEPTKFDQKNLEVGLEYNYMNKDIKDVQLLSVDVPGFANGKLDLVGNKVRMNQELVTVGYKLSDMLTPYAIMGLTQVDANIRLNGDISTPWYSGGTTLLEIPYGGGSAFTYGAGAKGDLVELPKEVILGYDLRMTRFTNTAKGEVVVLPTVWNQGFPKKSTINYYEWSILLDAHKTFVLNKDNAAKKYFLSVTPMVGIKYADSMTNTKLDADIYGINVQTKQNVNAKLVSGVIGASCKVTQNIDAKITGTYGGEKGISAGMTYHF